MDFGNGLGDTENLCNDFPQRMVAGIAGYNCVRFFPKKVI